MSEPSKPLGPGGRIEVTVVEASNMTKLGSVAFDDTFRVAILFGDQTSTTETRRRRKLLGPDVLWNQTFPFTFNGEIPTLTLEIYGKTTRKKGFHLIGRAVVSCATLSASDTPEIGVAKTHDLSLSDKDGVTISTSKNPMLRVSVKFVSLVVEEPVDDLAPILKLASDALDRLKGPNIPGLSLNTGLDGSAASNTAMDAGCILTTIGKVAEFMDKLSEIHPYAKLAWDILDVSRKVIMAQVQEDESVHDLFNHMGSLLARIQAFMDKLDDFVSSDIHTDEKIILRDVVSTSRACADFITKYCKPSFGRRAMKRTFSIEANTKIQDFQSRFESLEKKFNEKIWDGTSMIAHQILEKMVMDQIQASFTVPGVTLLASEKQSCLKGTRMTIRKEITDWIDRVDEDVPRALLLSGMAGTGKSTIAYTIADECADQGKLCTSFAFNRRAQPPPAARMLFPHIAASLATFYPAIRKCLADPQKQEVASGSNLDRQLQKLIVEPLKKSTQTNLVRVIVTDALDEADDDGIQAKKLVSLLADHCAELPSNIRILITSRPETYVTDMQPRASVQHLVMPDCSDPGTLADVGHFVRAQLKNLRDMDNEDCDKLAETSQGLFQWAAIACQEIVGSPLQMGSTSHQRYEMVVASGVGRDKAGLLDLLYDDVLRRTCDPDKNPDGHQLMKKVIAVLFALMEPMTLDAFRQLYDQLGFGGELDIENTLPYLASLLNGISDRTRPVQPNHTSLRDFFLDPDRSKAFCIKDLLPATHGCAARSSFRIVSTSLHQDMCSLDFPRLDDAKYVKLEADRVHRNIPLHLAYTILYWVKHLAEAPAPEDAFWTNMETSFLAENRALRWIEVFCLLVMRRLSEIWNLTPPELSGCMGLLAHITKQRGSSCSEGILPVVELLSTIVDAQNNPPFSFVPIFALRRLREIHYSVAWTVRLRHQPKDGPSVTVGSGFFLNLRGASYDVILTVAHNLIDTNGQPHRDLVVDIPQQVPRVDGASQFTDIHHPVPRTNIRVCAAFLQKQEFETDWGAILLPRGTALKDGFEFDTQPRDPGVMGVSIYGIPSWFPHHFACPFGDSNNLVDNTPTGNTAHIRRPKNPVPSGAPTHTFVGFFKTELRVRGICNSTYRDAAYTTLTSALVGELGLWVGLGKSNTRMRLLPPALFDSGSKMSKWGEGALKVKNGGHSRTMPRENDLFLFVDEEDDSRLYLKRGYGSAFDVRLRSSQHCAIAFGSRLVEALEKNTAHGGRLACVSAADYEGGRGLTVRMDADEDQQGLRETITLYPGLYYFDVESTPIPSSSHGDSQLFKISIQPSGSEVKRGSIRYRWLKFALEQ